MGTFLWLLFVPLAGTARLVWRFLRTLAWLRYPAPIALVGLFVVLRTPNPLTAQVSNEGVAALGSAILPWAVLGLGSVIGALGVRSRTCRRLRRRLERRGWFLGASSPEWRP